MGSSSGIGTFEHDGLYSWLVLITIIFCNFSSSGFIGGNLGVKSGYYPDIFDAESARTNVISSVALGVFLLTGKSSHMSVIKPTTLMLMMVKLYSCWKKFP